MSLFLVKLAGVLGSTGVAAEAVGAHGFKGKEAKFTEAFRTGARFQTLNSVALLALSSAPLGEKRLQMTGAGLALGTVLFSGACYAYAILEEKMYSKPAPLGGTVLMATWLSLLF